jgi:hypothetical protein
LSHIFWIASKCWLAIFAFRDAEFGGEKDFVAFTGALEP